jgi:hypothetical protein
MRRVIKETVLLTETSLCQILSSIPPSRLIPYVEETIWFHQYGFRRNRSTTDHVFRIPQIPGTKSTYNEAVHQLCIYFKTAYDSVHSH